jgi:hypothetical protein
VSEHGTGQVRFHHAQLIVGVDDRDRRVQLSTEKLKRRRNTWRSCQRHDLLQLTNRFNRSMMRCCLPQ